MPNFIGRMHEVYLVQKMFENLESEFNQQDLKHLEAIDQQIGLLANAEPTLMQNVFLAVTQTFRKYLRVKLNIELIPIEIYCADCDKTVAVKRYKFICDCGKSSSKVIKGTELPIDKLHFSA